MIPATLIHVRDIIRLITADSPLVVNTVKRDNLFDQKHYLTVFLSFTLIPKSL